MATGLGTSAAGVLLFAAVHAALIEPIWTAALVGAPRALVAGLAMAWAFDVRFAGTGVQPLRAGAAFGARLYATIVPATIAHNALRLQGWRLNDATEIPLVLLLAAASGTLAGAIGRPGQIRARVSFAAATVGLTLVMGGPIPVVNSTRAAWLFAAFFPLAIAASTVLALVRWRWFSMEASETP